MATLKAR